MLSVAIKRSMTLPRSKMLQFTLQTLNEIAEKPEVYKIRNENLPSVIKAVEIVKPLMEKGNSTFLLEGEGPTAEVKPVMLPFNEVKIPHSTGYDLIGYVLSNASEAPPNTEPEEYHLPLLYMYSRMCLSLADGINKRAGPQDIKVREPQMGHLSWVTKRKTVDDQIDELLLSAGLYPEGIDDTEPGTSFSVAGYTGSKETVKGKSTSSRSEQQAIGEEALGAGFDLSQRSELVAQNFGHCAETLPLLYLISFKKEYIETAQGYALSTKLLNGAWGQQENTNLSNEELSKCLRDPCANCQILIKQYGIHLENFLVAKNKA